MPSTYFRKFCFLLMLNWVSLFHIKWYLYCCREFLVRLHTTPFLGLWLFVLPVVFPLLSLYIYICIYIFVYILFFGSWIAPFAKPILLIYLELFLLHLEPLFLFRFPILHCISASGFSWPKVAAFGEFGLLLLKQIYVQMPVSARIHVSLCFGAFLLWIHFFLFVCAAFRFWWATKISHEYNWVWHNKLLIAGQEAAANPLYWLAVVVIADL